MHMMYNSFYELQVLEYWAGRGMLQILYGFIFISVCNFLLFSWLVPTLYFVAELLVFRSYN